MTYCTDIDLLHWEPNIFRDAVFASQQLLGGNGNLNGTTFTLSSGSLADAHVVAGNVIVLSGAVTGSYPIIAVNGATELTLSVLYDGLFPDQGGGQPSPAGVANGLSFVVRTFWPQRKIVSDLLARAAGVGPEMESTMRDRSIVNTEAMRRPCALGSLQLIYSALAAAAEQPGDYSIRAELYGRLYRRALHQTRVELDLNGDGAGDVVRPLGVVEMVRR